MSLSRTELQSGFRGLGIRSGEQVIVHSSLSSLGRVDGGADTVVDALLSAVDSEGTVAVPTFTRYDEPYDPVKTPSTTGAITEALRQRENAVRSDHPTKSVAAIGPDAEALITDHDPMNSLGPGSPFHRLLERNARILLLGVDHTANSAIHIGERLAGVPYRDQMAGTKTRVSGDTKTVQVNRVHCSRGFEAVHPLAKQADIVSLGQIGTAEARLLDGNALLALVVELLGTAPGALLCSIPDCDRCQYARKQIAASSQ